MKRFIPLAAIACLIHAQSQASAQNDTPATNHAQVTGDPVADLTAQIMQRLLPRTEASEEEPAVRQAESKVNQPTPPPHRWSSCYLIRGPVDKPVNVMFRLPPSLADAEQQVQQAKQLWLGLPASALSQPAVAQSVTAMARANSSTTHQATAAGPQAIAISVQDGRYAIEATVTVDAEPKTVRLSGTQAEVLEQLEQLEPAVREVLNTRLGMRP